MIRAMKSFTTKIIFILFFTTLSSLGAVSIETTNRILSSVGEKSITVLDVKREMDRQLYRQDKKIFSNPEAVYSYYAQNWKHILQKMVNDEILLLEAEKSKYEVKSHDVNQKMKELYGDDQVDAFRFLSITPEQALQNSKKELISAHLSWYKIWSKAFLETTPGIIRKAYETHIAELPKKDEWTYQALYIKGKDQEVVDQTASNIASLLKDGGCTNLSAILENINTPEDLKVGLSKDITLSSAQLSPNLLSVLENLEAGKMSEVISGKTQNAYSGKVLHLKGFKKEPIPSYREMNAQIKDKMLNIKGGKIAHGYFEKLYKSYDIAGLYGMKLQSSNLTPFTLQDD
ncbi:MAG: hypothetical protein S4CHLAM20_06550 [Chlamydiia bacterium]|nr:hypothetical protein [Chlamydiia bacterium]